MNPDETIIITQTIMAASAAFLVVVASFALVWLRHIRDELRHSRELLEVIRNAQIDTTAKELSDAVKSVRPSGSTTAEKTEDPELTRVTSERDRLSLALARVLDDEYQPPPQYTAWAQASYTEGVNAVLTRLRTTLQP